jgi:hypothetical protein
MALNEIDAENVRPLLRLLLRKQLFYLTHDITGGGIPKSVGVDDLAAVDVNTELADAAFLKFYLCADFTAESRRRPGSNEVFDGSKATVVDLD